MSTQQRAPRQAVPTAGSRGNRTPPAVRTHSAVRRTALALVAAALGIVPLQGLFSDHGWLLDGWLSMLVVLAPALVLRRRRAPGAMDIWIGIVLLVPWLTLRFLSDTAVAGIIPTGDTWTRLSELLTQLHQITREEVAPIPTSLPVRLVVCALVGLLAALIDLIAVVGRRGALAGVPLMIVFTVAGAVPRQPVAWQWFALAAVGFLLLLALDSGDELDRWGRRIRSERRGGAQTGRAARSTLAITAPRIAVVAVVAALALPLLVPGDSRNLLADAFHGGSGLGGLGSGSNGRLSPFAKLTGDLREAQANPRKLADVQMLGSGDVDPYYLRVNVLSDYTSSGWQVASHGERTSIGGNEFPVDAGGSPDTVTLEARITVDGQRGTPGVFNYPVAVSGLDSSTGWSSQDQLLLDTELDDNTQYTVRFQQPEPTRAQLGNAPADINPAVRSELEVPNNLSETVRTIVREQTSGKASQYDKALALSQYFADPSFTYSLQTKPGDSSDDLVSFLQTKQGFCQQYAAAMGIMLRVAGVPSRVVLGYLNSGPDRNGHFSVSTRDAHAWVEAWFAGIGWVPFDPTPSSGLPGGGVHPAWDARDAQQQSPSASASAPTASSSAAPSTSAAPSRSSSAAPVAQNDNGGSNGWTGWLVGIGIVLALALVSAPALVRATRRRRRYLAARLHGDAEPLWRELSDTALDLGFVWSDARSPRQVASWLAPEVPGAESPLRTLADAVERSRYAPGVSARSDGPAAAAAAAGSSGPDASDALRSVTGQLRSRRSARTRLRAVVWPASLGWSGRFGATGRHEL